MSVLMQSIETNSQQTRKSSTVVASQPIVDAITDHSIRKQLTDLFERSAEPHSFLHPDSLQAWFGEASGWLGDLLRAGGQAAPRPAPGGAELRLVEAGGDEDQLRRWHDGIAGLIDRMSQDLEES